LTLPIFCDNPPGAENGCIEAEKMMKPYAKIISTNLNGMAWRCMNSVALRLQILPAVTLVLSITGAHGILENTLRPRYIGVSWLTGG